MANTDDHEVVSFIIQQLGREYPQPPVPAEAVDRKVENWRAKGMYEELTDADWEMVARLVKSRVLITMEPGETLSGVGLQNWLPDRHAEIVWRRWYAYKQLLTQKGFTPSVLSSLDESTDEILNCLGDPTVVGSWKRRGLVIGDVQSGKTATYIGAVNKAADAGYKLIILLAGGTEALRKQTQFRVDEGFIGRDSSHSHTGDETERRFGVGNWQTDFLSAQGLTTQETDFRKTSKRAVNFAIDPNSSTPYVFVLKKNKTALENLRDWLKQQQIGESLLDVPMLVVDDESDYASVNTRAEDSPTVINALIRSILGRVTKSSYLAFTATPFANVFIDHETTQDLLGDDLFPRDYIRTLDAPSNYVGSKSYFGTEQDVDTTRLVNLDDAEGIFPIKHKATLQVVELPESLVDAIRSFVVAVAIREVRGDTSARAMLVNVSRFKKVQAQIHGLVEAEFQRIRNAIELHSLSFHQGSPHIELSALQRAFNRHFGSSEVTWDQVLSKLTSAVHSTSVRLINSDRVKQVNDLSELESERMIAVGGDVLSRGLTLEGLTISYFHRSVGASDTLLQMARWFGYRPGYDDLCRVWLPEDVADQFRYVAGIVDELRGQLRAMKKQGLTPKDFGLMVRMHPETLKITAQNKMGAAERKPWTVDIAAKNIETVDIDPSSDSINGNFDAVMRLVDEIGAAYPDRSWVHGDQPWPTMPDVDKHIVSDFLSEYKHFVTDALFDDNVLAGHIKSTSNPRLENWTVAFVSGEGHVLPIKDGLQVAQPTRTIRVGRTVSPQGRPDIAPLKVSGGSNRLAGKEDLGRTFRFAAAVDRVEPRVYEAMIGHGPALLIYLLEPKTDKSPEAAAVWNLAADEGARCIVAVKVAIPGRPGEKGAEVNYMLNSVALKAWTLAVVEQTDPEDRDDLDGADDE